MPKRADEVKPLHPTFHSYINQRGFDPLSEKGVNKNKMAVRYLPAVVVLIMILLILVLSDDLSAAIHTAVRAYLMGSLVLTALRADRQSRSLELPYVGSSLHFTSM